MILADNPAGKICKQLQYTVRSLATPPPLTEAIPQQHPECSISSACTPAPGPGGDVVRSDKLLGMGLITVTRNFLSGCLGASVQADTEVKRGGTSSLRDESSCGTAPWQSGSWKSSAVHWSGAGRAGLAQAAGRVLLGELSQRSHHGHQCYILAFLTLQPGKKSPTPVMMLWRPQLFTCLWRSKAKQHDLCRREAHCQNWSKGSRMKLTRKWSFCCMEQIKDL